MATTDKPIVIVQVRGGEWIKCLFTDDVQVIILDEGVPDDRLYRLSNTSTPEEIAAALGGDEIGSFDDGKLSETKRQAIIATEARMRGETLHAVPSRKDDL